MTRWPTWAHVGPQNVMELDSATIITGFVVSTVGFSLFLYGRKQRHIPALAVGILMMVVPFLGLSVWLQWAACAALTAGLWVAIRRGLA